VTYRILICCDGTPVDRPGMALERCRAFLPVTPAEPAEMATAVNRAGWRARDTDGTHLCPACVRAILAP
jgi:hypothetical protein